jgi:hypothetical protein
MRYRVKSSFLLRPHKGLQLLKIWTPRRILIVLGKLFERISEYEK